MTALDSDQSSYKQSDEEESEVESDTDEFSGKAHPHILTPHPHPHPHPSHSSLLTFLTVGGKKKTMRVGAAAVTGGNKLVTLPPLLSRVNGTIHVSIT